MVITKELYRSYIINMIDSSQKKEKIRLKSRVKSVIKNMIIFMRDYTYNIFNNSGKDSLCEKQEY